MSRHQRRRGKRGDSLLLPQASVDPNSLRGTMAEHLQSMQVRNYTPPSVLGRAACLNLFALWCEERGLMRPGEVTKPILERYQRHLFHYRKKNGRPLGVGTQYGRLQALRMYFRWLAKQNLILYNPASDLEMPRRGRHLPHFVLTPLEAEQVLSMPDIGTPSGIRDRAMLETMYSTGVRRMELVQLDVFAIKPELGVAFVRQGKGQKDRVVPIGERALQWVDKYLQEVRPTLVVEPDAGVLFLTEYGEAFNPARLTTVVREYVLGSGVARRGACHLFRHTVATAMLENGADVRYVQELLGHASLESTQVYTHVSIRQLKAVHAATHPASKDKGAGDVAPVPAEETEREEALVDPQAALLSSLAAEAEAETAEELELS